MPYRIADRIDRRRENIIEDNRRLVERRTIVQPIARSRSDARSNSVTGSREIEAGSKGDVEKASKPLTFDSISSGKVKWLPGTNLT